MNCPCGSGKSYDACCGPYLIGEKRPVTPELLMRSRFTAYSMGRSEYLQETQTMPLHPLNPKIKWTKLEVIEAKGDTVEFKAYHSGGCIHEKSHFRMENDRWMYVSGEHFS